MSIHNIKDSKLERDYPQTACDRRKCFKLIWPILMKVSLSIRYTSSCVPPEVLNPANCPCPKSGSRSGADRRLKTLSTKPYFWPASSNIVIFCLFSNSSGAFGFYNDWWHWRTIRTIWLWFDNAFSMGCAYQQWTSNNDGFATSDRKALQQNQLVGCPSSQHTLQLPTSKWATPF